MVIKLVTSLHKFERPPITCAASPDLSPLHYFPAGPLHYHLHLFTSFFFSSSSPPASPWFHNSPHTLFFRLFAPTLSHFSSLLKVPCIHPIFNSFSFLISKLPNNLLYWNNVTESRSCNALKKKKLFIGFWIHFMSMICSYECIMRIKDLLCCVRIPRHDALAALVDLTIPSCLPAIPQSWMKKKTFSYFVRMLIKK